MLKVKNSLKRSLCFISGNRFDSDFVFLNSPNSFTFLSGWKGDIYGLRVVRNGIWKKKKNQRLYIKGSATLHAFPTKSNSGNFLIMMNQHPAWLATKPIRTRDISTRIILNRIMLTESQVFRVSNISKNVVVTGILEFHEVSFGSTRTHSPWVWTRQQTFLAATSSMEVFSKGYFCQKVPRKGSFIPYIFLVVFFFF